MAARLPGNIREVLRMDYKFFVALRDKHSDLRAGGYVRGPVGVFFVVSWGKPRLHYVCKFLGQGSALREDPHTTRAKALGVARRATGVVMPAKKGPRPRPYRGPNADIRNAHKSPNHRVLTISNRMYQGNGCIYYVVETVPEGTVVCEPDFRVYRHMTGSRKVHPVGQSVATLREALGVAKAASIRPSQARRQDEVPEGREPDQYLRFLKTDSGSKT